MALPQCGHGFQRQTCPVRITAAWCTAPGEPSVGCENIFFPNAWTNPGQLRDHPVWLHTNSALVFNFFFSLKKKKNASLLFKWF